MTGAAESRDGRLSCPAGAAVTSARRLDKPWTARPAAPPRMVQGRHVAALHSAVRQAGSARSRRSDAVRFGALPAEWATSQRLWCSCRVLVEATSLKIGMIPSRLRGESTRFPNPHSRAQACAPATARRDRVDPWAAYASRRESRRPASSDRDGPVSLSCVGPRMLTRRTHALNISASLSVWSPEMASPRCGVRRGGAVDERRARAPAVRSGPRQGWGAHMIVRDRVSGRRLTSGTASVRTYARGRICRAGGCGTVLSAYNPSRLCALHERALPRPRRAGRQ